MDLIREQWEEIKEALKHEYEISNIAFETWIKPLQLDSVVDDVVYIIIPNDKANVSSYISSKYKTIFQVAISEKCNHTYDVSFILEKDVTSISNNKETPSQKPIYNINYDLYYMH